MAGGGVAPGGLGWLGFALLTVLCWGVYGLLLHAGQLAMADPASGRMKAFLMVGLAYVLVAVLAPLALLAATPGASWSFPARGVGLSVLAGTAGAIGALGVLLAFGARGSPPVVMSIVFAGAPVVNAAVALTLAGQWRSARWPFLVGIALAALGGALVTLYRPGPAAGAPPARHAGR